ncbi:YfiR family protein [Cesiribacter andamanensis]|uniref:DUF4154 domain-containing protein n=1 Tax=Cesiribacter andamanensis AMV16 TaxID=1279009 RepID=M7N0K5_9BACT|nr:YfiR family protein [Cesiribacter andamanensis]EMR02223.1 hypothetical protein ADICEAN_02618 [Cesiribacter andamanensis AMV16]
MKKILLLGIALCLLPLGSLLAQAVNHKAHSVFLYNFVRYAEWPANAPDNEVIRFGVLGKSGVFDELDEVLKVKTVNGKKCLVERITDPSKVGFYHIIFVADGESGKLADLLAAIGSRPTLVVTERDNLVRKGAAISFMVSDDNKLQFQLNDQVLTSRNIQLAASLRSMAQPMR